MKNHKKGIAFAILTALLWGFLAILIKVALNKANPVTIVWVRMTVAMLIVGFYYCVFTFSKVIYNKYIFDCQIYLMCSSPDKSKY